MSLRTYAWQLLPPPQQQRFVSTVNAVVKPEPLDPGSTEVRYATLPFYERVRFCRIIDHRQRPPNDRFALAGAGEIVLLNKGNEPIYRCNATAPIRLSPDNVAQYAAFFFDHVAGRHGRFLLVDAVDDMRWLAHADPARIAEAAALVRPHAYKGVDEGGRFVIETCVVFKDALFRSLVRVAADGQIGIADETLLAEHLPVRTDIAPGVYPRHAESEGQLYLPTDDHGGWRRAGVPPDGWLPMDAAPRDGTPVVVLSVEGAAFVASWNPSGSSWADESGNACGTGLGTIRPIGHWRCADGWLQANEVVRWRPLSGPEATG